MGRKSAFVVGVLVLGALLGGLVGVRRPLAPSVGESVATTPPKAATVEVHVAGWVVRPGVVTVDEDAIVADAIEAAGGMKAGARGDLINLAAPIVAGEQVLVPGPDEDTDGGSAGGGGLVSLNRADASALQNLPGVGPVLAGRIVAFRAENGPFDQVEDLLQVPGIGEAKLSSLRDLVQVP